MFLIEALGATASKSSIQAVCLDIIVNRSKWHQMRQYFDYIAKFENDFCLVSNSGNHHPEQGLKIWNIFKRNICGGAPL